MKISEILASDVARYLKLSAGEYDEVDVQTLIDTSKSYIKSYTGLDDAGLDLHDDFTIVIYILCQDMHDNRTLYVDKTNLNRVVTTILDMHATNLLATPEVTI